MEATTATKTISIRREFDIRPIDFSTGKRVALPRDEMKECECCGRRIVKVFEMANMLQVGSECAYFLAQPVCRRGKKNTKAIAILEAM